MSVENNSECTENISKIFVGNVPFQCTKEEFMECFKKYTGVIDADIVNRFNSSNSRGFGFVTFDSPENATLFIETCDNVTLKNRTLRFTRYISNSKKASVDKIFSNNYLFLKNIDKKYKPSDIKMEFSKYSDIGMCFINTNISTGESKGSAVIEIMDDYVFNTFLSAKEVIMDGKQIEVMRWKQNIKIKKGARHDIKDVYRTAFNAGRATGFSEGIKCIALRK